MLHVLLNDASNWNQVYGITGSPGCGKSHIAREFAASNANVFHISCDEFWNKKQFLQELLAKMGDDPSGMNCNDMMGKIVNVMLGLENPLIILDEADKLNDPVLYLFITLYNRLEDKCGIILMATDHLEKRINKGLRLNRKGYKEIFSRLGRKFIKLPEVSEKDILSVCKANGVESSISITEIWNDSEGDLRRVKERFTPLRTEINKPHKSIPMKTLSPNENRQKVLSLLPWTELEWANFQYQMGEAYLERSFQDLSAAEFEGIRASSIFWRWWTNQWNFRDECFIDYAHALSYHDRVIRYRQLHSPRVMKNQPHKIILESIYIETEKAMTATIKTLLC